jgi:proline iminopeptidase
MKINFAPTGKTWLFLTALLTLAVYFLGVHQWLGTVTIAQIELIVLGGLALILVVAILLLLFTLLAFAFAKKRANWLQRLRGQMIFTGMIIILLAVIVAASQWMAHTPPILGEDGQPLANSIASLEKIKLGGVDQWLIIRGHDVNKPVLLFLSGGPGSSEAGRVLRFNQELEKHFVVVIWEQRGCDKSYPSLNPKSALTVDQYAADIIELTDMLRERFDEEKIYLVGHSWGTVIGTRAVQARPDLFHAYVGTAQMVNVRETDQIIYKKVLEHSLQMGDMKFAQTLEKQGEPPYFVKSPIKPYSTLFTREYAVFQGPDIRDEEFRREGDLLLLMFKQPEYGWLDRLYYILSLKDTFNAVYPQLQEFDFRLDAATLDLPVYMILGRYDINGTYWIAEEYFNTLQAPHKQLYIFEDSGHGMIWEEAEKYHDILVNTVLPETYQP